MASAVISDAAALALPILLQFATPSAEMTIQIPAESVVVYEPGTLISVTMLHIPDQAGGKGITSQLFKVYSYTSDGNTATVQMIRMLPGGNVGLVGPAGEVASASGSDIVLKAGATTHLAPTAGSLFSDITNGEDGTEDCHYFRAGDYIQIIDASTLGTTPASSTKIIDSVAYGSLTITLTTGIPAGIAAGDIVRLSDYDDTITAGNSLEAFYTWWANSSLVIPAGSSDPYQWGG